MLWQRHRSSVELLPHDVVELILERLPVETLLRFKSVSNNWNSTISSRRFQERQLIRRKQSRGPDVLYASLADDKPLYGLNIVLGSSIISSARFPTWCLRACHGSCDGLVCLTSLYEPNVVINPATRWHRSFPLASAQQLRIYNYSRKNFRVPCSRLGFGKDKFRGTYKPVCLYNSSEFGLDNVTTCEVFDFGTNSWRYVLPASPYRVIHYLDPVYLDGSLYWLSECEETKLLSFDLHTETFQVTKTPFVHVRALGDDINLCILDNRLCVTEKKWPTQVIWSFDCSGGNKPWEQMCSIDLTKTYFWFSKPDRALLPIAILDKNKLLLHAHGYALLWNPLVIYDLHTKSYDLLFKPTTSGHCVSYFQSLFSV